MSGSQVGPNKYLLNEWMSEQTGKLLEQCPLKRNTCTWSCKEASFSPPLSQQARLLPQLLLGSPSIMVYCTAVPSSHYISRIFSEILFAAKEPSQLYVSGMTPPSRKHCEPMCYLQWLEQQFPQRFFSLVKHIQGCASWHLCWKWPW